MKTVLTVLGVFLIIAAILSLIGLVIMLIWNALAGYFGFKEINLWVAVLIALALGLVGSFFRGNSK